MNVWTYLLTAVVFALELFVLQKQTESMQAVALRAHPLDRDVFNLYVVDPFAVELNKRLGVLFVGTALFVLAAFFVCGHSHWPAYGAGLLVFAFGVTLKASQAIENKFWELVKASWVESRAVETLTAVIDRWQLAPPDHWKQEIYVVLRNEKTSDRSYWTIPNRFWYGNKYREGTPVKVIWRSSPVGERDILLFRRAVP